MPSKKKKYNARFPPARIKKIMQKDEDVGKVAAPVPVLISKALEIFVQGLITKASHETFSRNAKTLTTSHIKQCIEQESKFDFLKDLVESVPTMNCEDDDSNHSGSCHADRHPNSRRKQKIGRESSAQSSLQSVDEPSSDEDSCDSEDSSSRDEVQTHPAERIGGASSSKAASSTSTSSSSSLAHQATHHIPAAPYNSVPYQGLHPSSGAGGMMFPPPMAPHLHAPPHLPPPQGALGGNSPAMGSYMASLPQAAPHNNSHEDSDEDYDA